jgi:hypothetical protein
LIQEIEKKRKSKGKKVRQEKGKSEEKDSKEGTIEGA